MSKFLIIYSSTDGHTKKICQRIKNFLTDGNLVELLSLEDSKKVDFYTPFEIPKVTFITSMYKGSKYIKNFLDNIISLDLFDKTEVLI